MKEDKMTFALAFFFGHLKTIKNAAILKKPVEKKSAVTAFQK